MKSYSLKNSAFILFAGVILVIIAAGIVESGNLRLNSFVIREWYINYSAGFVRRGLSGTILLFAEREWSLHVASFLSYSAYLVFAFVALFYIRNLYRVRNEIPLHVVLILLFLPGAILMPILDYHVMGRKEWLFFVVLIGHILILNRFAGKIREVDINSEALRFIVNRYAIVVAVSYNILGVPTALTHEGILFLSIPANLVLTFFVLTQSYGVVKSLTLALLVYLPTTAISLLVIFHTMSIPFTRDSALIMCRSFEHLEHSNYCISGAIEYFIEYLTLNSADGFRNTYSKNVKEPVVLASWTLLILLNFFLATYSGAYCMATRIRKLGTHVRSSGRLLSFTCVAEPRIVWPLLLPALATLPLFTIALDWGRWTFIVITSFLICAVSSKHVFLPVQIDWRGARIFPIEQSKKEARIAPLRLGIPSLQVCVILFSFYVLSSTTLPHYGITPSNAVRYLSGGVVRDLVESVLFLLFEYADQWLSR